MLINFFHNRSTARRGNVLLLALLMLAGGMVGTLALTSIVTSQLRQSRVIDAGMIAHYEAESALEEGLYSARKLNEINPITDADTPKCPVNSTVDNSDLGCTSVNFNQTFSPSPNVSVPILSSDQTFELDVAPPSADPRSYTGLQFTWKRGDGVDPSLVITYVNKTADNTPIVTRQPHPIGVPYSCGAGASGGQCTGQIISLDPPNVPQLVTQKVRFRAVSGDIKDLEIIPNGCVICGFDNYVKLKTRGKKGDVGYTVQVSIPTSVPAYGIADYVLFSEQEVKK
ncbi:MAG: hypothetical protein AAB657_04490 [Patescibacteria group bacterium]